MINRTLNREPPAWYVCQLTILKRNGLRAPEGWCPSSGCRSTCGRLRVGDPRFSFLVPTAGLHQWRGQSPVGGAIRSDLVGSPADVRGHNRLQVRGEAS